MKTVLLFRHAKSDWEAEAEFDRDRPLNKRGKRDAKRMGRHLSTVEPCQTGWSPPRLFAR